jgi:hypothetical protein
MTKIFLSYARGDDEPFVRRLPATAVVPDGDILVVYCSGPLTDQTDALWARLRPNPKL